LSWQDELRKLDEDLATGRIAADEYRVRRDAVLSSAATVGQQQPSAESAPQSGPAEATHMMSPVAGPQQQPNSERTQVVGPADTSADRTQVVSGQDVTRPRQSPVPPGWQQVPPHAQGGWPQAVPGVPPQGVAGGQPLRQPGPGGYPGQQPHEWDAGAESNPWGDAKDFPALAPFGSQDWVRQGPEVFDNSSWSAGKKTLVIVAVVVVLAGLGVGGFFLFGNKGHQTTANQGGGPTQTQVTSTPQPKPQDPLAIADLPGTQQDQSGIGSFSDVLTQKLLTSDENTVYENAGATTTKLASSTVSGTMHVSVMTVRTASPEAAASAVAKLDSLQIRFGMKTYGGTTPPGVQITSLAPSGSTPATIRGHYSHDNTVVRIQVDGPSAINVGTLFDQVLQAQLAALPADG
jgi:hypothetical protein